MKHWSRVLAFVLAVIMLTGTVSPAVYAAPGGSGPISLSAPKEAQVGETVTVDIDAAAATIEDGKLVLSYDSAKLTYISASVHKNWSEIADVVLAVNSQTPGRLILAFTGDTDAKLGTIITLTFKAAAGGEANITADSSQSYVDSGETISASATVNIAVPTGRLTVTKSVVNYDGADITDSTPFSFTLKLDGGEEQTFTLKDGESKTFDAIPEGTKYTVTEKTAEGYTTAKNEYTGTIVRDAESKVTFTNKKDPELGSLTVTKDVVDYKGADITDTTAFSFTVEFSDGRTENFTLKDGESKTFKDLIAGTEYTVTEKAAEGYSTEKDSYTGRIVKDVELKIGFTNKKDPDLGSLTITKNVVDYKDSDITDTTEFSFTVEFSDGETETFTLKDGESKTFEDMIAGTTYTVTEKPAAGYSTEKNEYTGTIAKDTESKVTFTNKKDPDLGSLTVTKSVIDHDGTDIEDATEFNFTVEFSDGETETFTLKDGESKTFGEIIAGTTYTVTEEAAEGYTTEENTYTGTIEKDTESKVEFTNKKDPELGSLTVTKNVVNYEGADIEDATEFSFTVVFSSGKVESFTLKEGESKTFEGLLAGTTYSVTEKSHQGYKAERGTLTGTIEKDTEAKAEFVNRKNQELGSLTVTKSVVDSEGRDVEDATEFTFTVEFSDGTSETFTLSDGGSRIFGGIPAGMTYTVTETAAEGYTPEQSVFTGTITKDARADFVNVRDKAPGHGDVCPSRQFTDIHFEGEYHDAVDFVVENGYILGTAPDTFSPYVNSNRAMAVTILYRIAGEPEVTGRCPFTDVEEGAYYYDAVVWAYQEGIAKGITTTIFDPYGTVLREQFVTFLYRFATRNGESMNSIYEDYIDIGEVSGYARVAMRWAVRRGIVLGTTPETLSPRDPATRIQEALMLRRYLAPDYKSGYEPETGEDPAEEGNAGGGTDTGETGGDAAPEPETPSTPSRPAEPVSSFDPWGPVSLYTPYAETGVDYGDGSSIGKWSLGSEYTSRRVSSTDAAQQYDEDDEVTFIVVANDAPLMQKYSVADISAQTSAVQSTQRAQMEKLDSIKGGIKKTLSAGEYEIGYTYTVASTAISVTTTYGNREALEKIAGVGRVYVAPTFDLPEDSFEGTYAPTSANAGSMIGAATVNSSGYTGKGTVIAILDTGLVTDHPNFKDLSTEDLTDNSLTTAKVESVWSRLHASHGVGNATTAHYSNKIPYTFNYAANNVMVDHRVAGSDHGTHVAGIAAGNGGQDERAKGIAPDAQLVIMQVFSGGGAGWDTIMAALEDCVILGVDTINMSLGSGNGFTDSQGEMLNVVERFKKSDIQLLCAAGNDTNSALNNATNTNMPPLDSPDTGLVGTPSTYSAAISVASADNSKMEYSYITVLGRKIPYVDTATYSSSRLAVTKGGQELQYVIVPGNGERQDYEKLNVTGKVAVVSRGVTSFTEKQTAAQNAGAVACIIYNTESGILSMQTKSGSGSIPCVSISKADGEFMKKNADNSYDKTGKLTVSDSVEMFEVETGISSFSSWGVTPDLKLKPEITGVGGSVYSSVDPKYSGGGNYYATMSGTSMATPQLTGAFAVLDQYLTDKFPNLTGEERRTVATNIMMSTATPLTVESGLENFPRLQGAGLVDLAAATTAEGYLSNPDASEGRPKAELGDSTSGNFTFDFEIHNISASDRIYTLDSSIFTDSVAQDKYIAGVPRALDAKVRVTDGLNTLWFDLNDDGQVTMADVNLLHLHVNGKQTIDKDSAWFAYLDVNMDGAVDKTDVKDLAEHFAELKEVYNAVTVKAGDSVSLSAAIDLTGEDKSYMSVFPKGIYVEGFLYANPIDTKDTEGKAGETLNMPILGYYGDWSAPALFDEPQSENALLYPRRLYGLYHELGTNPYVTGSSRVGSKYNAVSVENFLDELDFGMLRSAKKVTLTAKDSSTGKVISSTSVNDVIKSFYNASYGMVVPAFLYGKDQLWSGKLPENNTHVTYTVTGWLDDGDDTADGEWSFDFTVDTEYPTVNMKPQAESVTTTEDGKLMLELDIKDNQYIAAVLFVTGNDIIMGRYEPADKPGETITQKFDVTGFGDDFTVVVADYALNETTYDVSLKDVDNYNVALRELDKDRIYGSETYSQGYLQYGWFSYDKEHPEQSNAQNETFDYNRYYAGEFVNGYLIAQSINSGNIVLVTPKSSYWSEKTLWTQSKLVGEEGSIALYDMALDYKNGVLYAIGWEYGAAGKDGTQTGTNNFYKLDFSGEKVKLEKINKVSGTINGVNLLTMTCDDNGQLYGIDNQGNFYTVTNEGKCTFVGKTDFPYEPNLIQSMCYDHGADTIYWAACTSVHGPASNTLLGITYTVDPTSGKCTAVGGLNSSEQTCLFVPTSDKCDVFELGSNAVNFELDTSSNLLIVGQEKTQKIDWLPWYAAPAEDIKWSSSDEKILTVDETGKMTALSPGSVNVTAAVNLKNGQVSRSINIRVVASEQNIYGYKIMDYMTPGVADSNQAQSTWFRYSDLKPRETTEVQHQMIGSSRALWLGGCWYNGYVYASVTEGTECILYRFKANVENGVVVGFEKLEEVLRSTDLIGNMGVYYGTGRIYFKNLTQGGIGYYDLNNGEVGFFGKFKDIEYQVTSTDMCVMADGMVVTPDIYGNLYIIDPETMDTQFIGSVGHSTLDYGGMFYDRNTGSIYWTPCSIQLMRSTLYLVYVDRDTHDNYSARIVDLGSVHSKKGLEQTAMFVVPKDEPEIGHVPVTSVEIVEGEKMDGVAGGMTTLSYIYSPRDGTHGDAVWSSDNEEVVTVTQDGVVNFTGPGKANVTITLHNLDETKNPAVSDSIEFNIIETSGDSLYAYYIHGPNSTYNETWLSLSDSAPSGAQVIGKAGGQYSLRCGAYYDGYFYGYDTEDVFYRFNASDLSKFTVLGPSGLADGDRMTAITFDYTRGTMYGITEQMWFVEVDLATGEAKHVDGVKQGSTSQGQYLYTLTVDENGVFMSIGAFANNKSMNLPALYTLNLEKTDASFVSVKFINEKFGVHYASGGIKPQLTYDYATDRAYLYATQDGSKSTGLVILNMAEYKPGSGTRTFTDYSKVGNINPNGIKGESYLGLLAVKPKTEDLPDYNGFVTSVIMNRRAARVKVGETVDLSAQVQPSVADQKVEWTSSDESVATVDASGKVTTVAPGTATITATKTVEFTSHDKKVNRTVTATCQVTVAEADTSSDRIGYTVSLDEKALVSFDPQFPSKTTIVKELDFMENDGAIPVALAATKDGILILADDGVEDNIYELYRYNYEGDVVSKIGIIGTTTSGGLDLTYCEKTNQVVFGGGNGIWSYTLSSLDPDKQTFAEGTYSESGYGKNILAVEARDGEIYYLEHTGNTGRINKIAVRLGDSIPELKYSLYGLTYAPGISRMVFVGDTLFLTDRDGMLYEIDISENVNGVLSMDGYSLDTIGDGDVVGLAVTEKGSTAE